MEGGNNESRGTGRISDLIQVLNESVTQSGFWCLFPDSWAKVKELYPDFSFEGSNA